VLELEASGVDDPRGETPEHERIIWIWAVPETDSQERPRLTALRRRSRGNRPPTICRRV